MKIVITHKSDGVHTHVSTEFDKESLAVDVVSLLKKIAETLENKVSEKVSAKVDEEGWAALESIEERNRLMRKYVNELTIEDLQ